MTMEAVGNPERWETPVPDALDLVVETAAMLSILAAQQYARIHAMRREVLAETAALGVVVNEIHERSLRLELAAALSITESAAGRLIADADALVTRFPDVLDSLAGARMTPRHATLLVEVFNGVEPEFHETLLPDAIMLAEAHPVGTFRRLLRGLVETVRAATLTQRHQWALETRRVVTETLDDAMGVLHLYAPLVEITAIHARSTAIANTQAKVEGETRTLDQLRSDTLCDLLIDGTVDSLPDTARGIRAVVTVTVPVLALLDETNDPVNGVATLEGVGPIPMDRARELCGTATDWTRVLTHPETGIVLSVGRDRYQPPPSLRRLVKWRAETCMAPGCNIPATRCDIDHTDAWEHGGHTCLHNLCPLCKGHHTLKHHGGWCVTQIPDSGGALLWTSPTGRHYRVNPTRTIPSFQATRDDTTAAPF